jgi:hypothetical protein
VDWEALGTTADSSKIWWKSEDDDEDSSGSELDEPELLTLIAEKIAG